MIKGVSYPAHMYEFPSAFRKIQKSYEIRDNRRLTGLDEKDMISSDDLLQKSFKNNKEKKELGNGLSAYNTLGQETEHRNSNNLQTQTLILPYSERNVQNTPHSIREAPENAKNNDEKQDRGNESSNREQVDHRFSLEGNENQKEFEKEEVKIYTNQVTPNLDRKGHKKFNSDDPYNSSGIEKKKFAETFDNKSEQQRSEMDKVRDFMDE